MQLTRIKMLDEKSLTTQVQAVRKSISKRLVKVQSKAWLLPMLTPTKKVPKMIAKRDHSIVIQLTQTASPHIQTSKYLAIKHTKVSRLDRNST